MLTITETSKSERTSPSYKNGYMTSTWRSYNAKPRLYIHVEGENIMENILFRNNRPSKIYKSLLPEIFEALGLPLDTKASWSRTAGCTCGCSPGFVLSGVNVSVPCDFWATITSTEENIKVVDTDDAKMEALQRFEALKSQGIVAAMESAATETIANGTGRGDKGNLRNFRQMSDSKFFAVLSAVIDEETDNEAIEAVRAEARRRGAVS
jgi:hypothetical protein